MTKNKKKSKRMRPYKGGRDQRLPAGLATKDEYADVIKAIQQFGSSASDFYIAMARRLLKEKNGCTAHVLVEKELSQTI